MRKRRGPVSRRLCIAGPRCPRKGSLRYSVYELLRIRPGMTCAEVIGELRLLLYGLTNTHARTRIRWTVNDLLKQGYIKECGAYLVPIHRVPSAPSFATMLRQSLSPKRSSG